jgi:predicted transcriptional regulator YdeE
MVGPERVRLEALRVVGVEAWTSNRQEAEEATAAIPALWQRFHGEGLERRIPDRSATGRVCAVYTDYEGDHRSGYRLVVGVEVGGTGEVPAGMVAVTVPAGDYLVFAARGPMPDALVATWRRIWEYFEHAPVRRAYTADLEVHYPSGSAVDVCVALDRDDG